MPPAELSDAIKQSLSYKTGATITNVTPLTGGKNNQAFALTLDSSLHPTAFLKVFDLRLAGIKQKLERELAFYLHVQHQAMPDLIMAQPTEGWLLLSLIDGESVERPDKAMVKQAFSFIHTINQQPLVTALPIAADAMHSFDALCADIDKRQARKNELSADNAEHQACLSFLQEQLIPLFSASCQQFGMLAQQPDFYRAKQAMEQRWASPSDFGFHNALIKQDSQRNDAAPSQKDNASLCFFDFEYAGQDSLWKLMADFFAQPRIPTSPEYVSLIKEFPELAENLLYPDFFGLFYQLTQIKWTLIQLNEFFSHGQQKRQFALTEQESLNQRLIQAKRYFEMIPERTVALVKGIARLKDELRA